MILYGTAELQYEVLARWQAVLHDLPRRAAIVGAGEVCRLDELLMTYDIDPEPVVERNTVSPRARYPEMNDSREGAVRKRFLPRRHDELHADLWGEREVVEGFRFHG